MAKRRVTKDLMKLAKVAFADRMKLIMDLGPEALVVEYNRLFPGSKITKEVSDDDTSLRYGLLLLALDELLPDFWFV